MLTDDPSLVLRGITPVQRAFEIARTGSCNKLTQIERQLNREGYEEVHAQLSGPTLRKQLRDAIRTSIGSR